MTDPPSLGKRLRSKASLQSLTKPFTTARYARANLTTTTLPDSWDFASEATPALDGETSMLIEANRATKFTPSPTVTGADPAKWTLADVEEIRAKGLNRRAHDLGSEAKFHEEWVQFFDAYSKGGFDLSDAPITPSRRDGEVYMEAPFAPATIEHERLRIVEPLIELQEHMADITRDYDLNFRFKECLKSYKHAGECHNAISVMGFKNEFFLIGFPYHYSYSAPEMSRSKCLAAHAILAGQDVFEVCNVQQDWRFKGNKSLQANKIASYVACPITVNDVPIGVISFTSPRPRGYMAQSEKKALQTAVLKVTEGMLKVYENCLPDLYATFSTNTATSLLEGSSAEVTVLPEVLSGFPIPPSSQSEDVSFGTQADYSTLPLPKILEDSSEAIDEYPSVPSSQTLELSSEVLGAQSAPPLPQALDSSPEVTHSHPALPPPQIPDIAPAVQNDSTTLAHSQTLNSRYGRIPRRVPDPVPNVVHSQPPSTQPRANPSKLPSRRARPKPLILSPHRSEPTPQRETSSGPLSASATKLPTPPGLSVPMVSKTPTVLASSESRNIRAGVTASKTSARSPTLTPSSNRPAPTLSTKTPQNRNGTVALPKTPRLRQRSPSPPSLTSPNYHRTRLGSMPQSSHPQEKQNLTPSAPTVPQSRQSQIPPPQLAKFSPDHDLSQPPPIPARSALRPKAKAVDVVREASRSNTAVRGNVQSRPLGSGNRERVAIAKETRAVPKPSIVATDISTTSKLEKTKTEYKSPSINTNAGLLVPRTPINAEPACNREKLFETCPNHTAYHREQALLYGRKIGNNSQEMSYAMEIIASQLHYEVLMFVEIRAKVGPAHVTDLFTPSRWNLKLLAAFGLDYDNYVAEIDKVSVDTRLAVERLQQGHDQPIKEIGKTLVALSIPTSNVEEENPYPPPTAVDNTSQQQIPSQSDDTAETELDPDARASIETATRMFRDVWSRSQTPSSTAEPAEAIDWEDAFASHTMSGTGTTYNRPKTRKTSPERPVESQKIKSSSFKGGLRKMSSTILRKKSTSESDEYQANVAPLPSPTRLSLTRTFIPMPTTALSDRLRSRPTTPSGSESSGPSRIPTPKIPGQKGLWKYMSKSTSDIRSKAASRNTSPFRTGSFDLADAPPVPKIPANLRVPLDNEPLHPPKPRFLKEKTSAGSLRPAMPIHRPRGLSSLRKQLYRSTSSSPAASSPQLVPEAEAVAGGLVLCAYRHKPLSLAQMGDFKSEDHLREVARAAAFLAGSCRWSGTDFFGRCTEEWREVFCGEAE